MADKNNDKSRLSRVERNKREKDKDRAVDQSVHNSQGGDDKKQQKLSRVERNKQNAKKPDERLESSSENKNDNPENIQEPLEDTGSIDQAETEATAEGEEVQAPLQRSKSRARAKDGSSTDANDLKEQASVKEESEEGQTEGKVRRRSQVHEEETGRKRKKLFTWKRSLILIGIFFICALIGYTTIIYGGKLLVSEEKLAITPPTTIETEDGEIIWYLYDEFRLPVHLDQVPDHVQDAFVSIEDKRFYQHTGVDYRSIFRAIYRDIITRSKAEGASTLTQQLAKNLFLTNDKTFLRKTKEVMIALYLEREYSKEEILEMYLNVVYFGQGQYGIEAAANKYFFKSVDELSLEEGALLAGMVKAPNGYSPIDHPEKAEERRNLVLQTMLNEEKITEDSFNEAVNKEMTLNVSNRTQNVAYHSFVDLVMKELNDTYNISAEELRENRYKIVTTLQPQFQETAYEYFQYDQYFPGNNEDAEGAFVMLDKKGRILSAIGGRDYAIGNTNRVYVNKQPGSAIKPLAVYGPALMTDEFDAYTMVPDEKKAWDGWEEGQEVTNADGQYVGELPLYDALKQSKNTSAVWLLDHIGIGYAKSYLDKMGMPLEDDGLAIALGGLTDGVTPIQMAQAYTSFLNGGQMEEAFAVESIADYKGQVIHEHVPDGTEVFSKQVAWTMTEMLKEVVQSGTGTAGDYPYELAGKTGSTQHPHVDNVTKDAWFVGYTPEYVTALWMGNDSSDENHYLTGGSSYPTSLTKSILSEMNKQVAMEQTFSKPEGVVAMEEPIQLPIIDQVEGKYRFGGWRLVKGELTWEPSSNDERVVYRIYTYDDEESELVGEVTGETTFELESVSLFNQHLYYVVPYDPLTGTEGNRSEVISLQF